MDSAKYIGLDVHKESISIDHLSLMVMLESKANDGSQEKRVLDGCKNQESECNEKSAYLELITPINTVLCVLLIFNM
jgi:hypothetical protein